MKFSEGYQYFKHKNGIDAFIRVRTVTMDSGDNAILWIDWMIQGVEMYWHSPVFKQRIFIKADQYDNWLRYEPKGEIY